MGPTGGNMPHGQDAGFLGKAYDPFVLNADPSKPDFKVPDLLPPERHRRSAARAPPRSCATSSTSTVKDFEASESAKLMDTNFASAYQADDQHEGRATRST